jgi:hypothetical protein
VVTDNFGFVRNIAITDDISQSDCPSLSVKRRYCEKTGSSYTLYHCTDSLDESEWCLKKAEYLTKSECDDLLRRATQW